LPAISAAARVTTKLSVPCKTLRRKCPALH